MDKSIIDFSNITDKDLYIDAATKITEDDDETNLNISWASLVEEELGNSLNDKKLVGSINNKTIVIQETQSDIDKIMESDIKILSDILILEYQNIVCASLRKYVKHIIDNFGKDKEIKFDPKTFIKKLDWLKGTSKYLSDKIGLPSYHNENKTNKLFQRSSYKFCNYNYECEFNYNIQKYTGCFAQHYVHNIVYDDLVTLSSCINKLYQNSDFKISLELLRELKKSISTISFVINHMFEELKNVQVVLKKSVGHIDRKSSRKNNRKKRDV